MGSRLVVVLLTAAMATALLYVVSCDPHEERDRGSLAHYLLVAPAPRQPNSTTLGTIVVLQQHGGKQLRMRTEGGVFALPSDVGGTARASVCMQVPADGQPYYFDVAPVNAECLLFADLLGDPNGDADDCSGPVLENKLIAVSTSRVNLVALDASVAGADATTVGTDASAPGLDAGTAGTDTGPATDAGDGG